MNIIQKAVFYSCLSLSATTLFTSCESTDDEQPQEKIELHFVGDSIIEMWNTGSYFPTFLTYNHGVSRSRLADLDARQRPDSDAIVICQIGTNDLQYDFPTDASKHEYVEEYLRVIGSLSQNRVYLFSVLPSNVYNRDRNIPWFNDSIRSRLTELPKVVYLDVYDRFLADDNKSMKPEYTLDNLHVNDNGYHLLKEVLLDNLYQ